MRTIGVVGTCVVGAAFLGAGLVQCSSDAKPDAGTDGGNPQDTGAPDSGDGGGDAGIRCVDGGCASASLTCCGDFCVSLRSLEHCGACGTACTAGQFCTGSTCKDALFANVCEQGKGTVILDSVPNDDDAGGVLGAGLGGCDAGATLRYLPATNAQGALGMGGQPATGPGDTLVTAGGPYFQPSVQYMETSLTSIFVQIVNNGSQVQVIERKTQNKIVDQPISALTASHDYFVLQMAVEPQTATLTFMGYGLYGFGTTAGAWYFKNTLVPGRASYTDRWYVYEWTDTDASGGPTTGDTFTKVASGK